jgi:hypothetical protein
MDRVNEGVPNPHTMINKASEPWGQSGENQVLRYPEIETEPQKAAQFVSRRC